MRPPMPTAQGELIPSVVPNVTDTKAVLVKERHLGSMSQAMTYDTEGGTPAQDQFLY